MRKALYSKLIMDKVAVSMINDKIQEYTAMDGAAYFSLPFIAFSLQSYSHIQVGNQNIMNVCHAHKNRLPYCFLAF